MRGVRMVGGVTVVLLASGAVDARAQLAPLPRVDLSALEAPEAPHARLRASLPPSAAKVKEALKADPRVRPLTSALVAAAKMKDKAARKLELEKLAPQIRAVRADAMTKAGLDGNAVEQGLRSIANVGTFRAPVVTPPGTVLATTTVGSFPKPYSYKWRCPDQEDKADLDGGDAKLWATSTPFDDDCWVIRSGRTGTVQVPKGASRMRVDVRAKVDLDVVAIHYGTFAEVRSTLDVRIVSPKGVPLSTIKVAGKDTPLPAARFTLARLHTRSAGYLPVPFGTDSFADDLQEGDAGATAVFTLPPDADVGELEVTLYSSAEVDADLSGVGVANNLVTPKSLKVTFYK